MVPAYVVKYMEEYAYSYSVSMGYIEENDNGTISMSNLFDFIAGTSTGSLLVATLVMPDPSDNTTNLYTS